MYLSLQLIITASLGMSIELPTEMILPFSISKVASCNVV